MGAPRIPFASPPVFGALALKPAVDTLKGNKVSNETILPLPLVTNETIKLREIGSWKEISEGCEFLSQTFIANPGWFASIFWPGTPETGLNVALVSQRQFVW